MTGSSLRAAAVALAAAAVAACSAVPGSGEPTLAEAPAPGTTLFTRLPSAYTGVRFANRLEDRADLNVFTYRNYYNGGGVGVGDLDGDGRPDLVLTSNQDGPTVYRNVGAFRFRDVTRATGLTSAAGSWTTGVAIADVNGDGRLDVYLCKAGAGAPATRGNELWINEGVGPDSVPRFREVGRAWGVADEGWSTHAAWLDYDRDGRLDLFVIDNSPKPVSSFGLTNTRAVRDPYGGAKLYHNDGAGPDGAMRFTEVGARAGIHSPEVAFGLGLVVTDVNQDGWPDVYVANDFFERDYLYVNRGDGTFAEAFDGQTAVMSYFSMGLDAADVDNDGLPDVYTTDMLPEDEVRLKTTAMYEGWDVYQQKVRNGYGHQLMRNMLQRSNGDGTFTEIGQMAGVSRTDWSWGALLVDLDLDGRKDVYVTNGIAKDITSQDYVAFLANEQTMADVTAGGTQKVDFGKLVKAMSSTPLAHYAFRNAAAPHGGVRFTNEARAWGLDTPSFASGAAYADLDGDGAPDLVVNNVNGEAFVYRNDARTRHRDRHFLRVRLEGTGTNRLGIGARVALRVRGAAADAADADGETLVQEQSPQRGFQSSVDPVLTFGLGAAATVDTLTVAWPDGRVSTMTGVAADRLVTVRQADAAPGAIAPARPAGTPLPGGPAPLLADATADAALPFAHRENEWVDFDRERLLPHKLSIEGPAMAVADVNGDGLDDVFLGGAKEQPGAILLQQRDGRFRPSSAAELAFDAISEDVGAVFLDANGDGAPDLYVVSGGNEYSDLSPALQDRLYLNDGRGTFRKAPPDALPRVLSSGARPVALDYDGDGRQDLFVGGRSVPWQYGVTPRSLLLRNVGGGRFEEVADRDAPGLATLGMVTDAAWADVDGDGRRELVVVGEWMPITIFRAAGGKLQRLDAPSLASTHGWWTRVVARDLDGDGRAELVVGNLGLNARLRATPERPVSLYVKDWARSGTLQQILVSSEQGKPYPFALRDDLIRAIPAMKAKYLNYKQYALQTVQDVFGDELADAIRLDARTFASSIVRADGNGGFTVAALPDEAQLAPLYGIGVDDVNGDGHADLLLAGNFDGFRPEIGRTSASEGVVLLGDGRLGWTPVRPAASGFRVPGQTRDLARLRTAAGPRWIVARNDAAPLVFRPLPTARRAPAPARTLAVR